MLQREIVGLCGKLTLKSPTKHLAQLIGSHCLSGVDIISPVLRGRDLCMASVLIAAKLRERDIDCPTVSVVAKAGRKMNFN